MANILTYRDGIEHGRRVGREEMRDALETASRLKNLLAEENFKLKDAIKKLRKERSEKHERLGDPEDDRWICLCGYPSLGHALYCSQCGASRVGPIQATEEELQGFIEHELRRMRKSPLSIGSFAMYHGSYQKYKNQVGYITAVSPSHAVISFVDGTEIEVLQEVLTPHYRPV